MVVAAPREMIDQLVRVVRRARLQPVGIDLEAFAILRALMPPASVLDEGSPDTDAQVVVHVGAEVTHVSSRWTGTAISRARSTSAGRA